MIPSSAASQPLGDPAYAQVESRESLVLAKRMQISIEIHEPIFAMGHAGRWASLLKS
jgi:hypothetical protein